MTKKNAIITIILAFILTVGITLIMYLYNIKKNNNSNVADKQNSKQSFNTDYEQVSLLQDFSQLIEWNIDYISNMDINNYYSNSSLVVDATYIGSSESTKMLLFDLNDLIINKNNLEMKDTFSLQVQGIVGDAFPELEIGDRIIFSVVIHKNNTVSMDDYYLYNDYPLFYIKSDGRIFSRFVEYNKYDGYDVETFKQLIRNN